jgi:hypothetical protein
MPGRTYWVRARQGQGVTDIIEGMQVYLGGANWEGGLGLDQVLGWKLIKSIPARAIPAIPGGRRRGAWPGSRRRASCRRSGARGSREVDVAGSVDEVELVGLAVPQRDIYGCQLKGYSHLLLGVNKGSTRYDMGLQRSENDRRTAAGLIVSIDSSIGMVVPAWKLQELLEREVWRCGHWISRGYLAPGYPPDIEFPYGGPSPEALGGVDPSVRAGAA